MFSIYRNRWSSLDSGKWFCRINYSFVWSSLVVRVPSGCDDMGGIILSYLA